MDKSSYIYMMGNASRRSLYAGVCASLEKWVWEHKIGLGGAFTKKYKCDRLVILRGFRISSLPLHVRRRLRDGDVRKKISWSNPSIPTGKIWLLTGTQMSCFSMANQ